VGIFLLFPLTLFAQWDDCVHEKTDGSCEYPGECGRYVDSNSDAICDHSQERPTQNSTQEVLRSTEKVTASQSVQTQEKTRYPLFVTVAIVSLMYAFTYILAQNKTITILTHKKIWNGVLVLSFLATVTLSIILIMRINSGYAITLPFDALYWHVVTGLVMMVVTFFHMGWHWRYYKRLFKK